MFKAPLIVCVLVLATGHKVLQTVALVPTRTSAQPEEVMHVQSFVDCGLGDVRGVGMPAQQILSVVQIADVVGGHQIIVQITAMIAPAVTFARLKSVLPISTRGEHIAIAQRRVMMCIATLPVQVT